MWDIRGGKRKEDYNYRKIKREERESQRLIIISTSLKWNSTKLLLWVMRCNSKSAESD